MSNTSGKNGVHEATFVCTNCGADLWLTDISEKLTARKKILCTECGAEQRLHLFYDGTDYCACLIPYEKG